MSREAGEGVDREHGDGRGAKASVVDGGVGNQGRDCPGGYLRHGKRVIAEE